MSTAPPASTAAQLTPAQRRELVEVLARAVVADLRADAEKLKKTA